MAARYVDTGRIELLDRAKVAFPWFDEARLSYFVDAVREAAYQGQRIVATTHPAAMPNPDVEQRLALAMIDAVAEQIGVMAQSIPVRFDRRNTLLPSLRGAVLRGEVVGDH